MLRWIIMYYRKSYIKFLVGIIKLYDCMNLLIKMFENNSFDKIVFNETNQSFFRYLTHNCIIIIVQW